MHRFVFRRLSAAVALFACCLGVSAVPATAAPTPAPLVGLNPTPDATWMANGPVLAMARIGNRIYIGGAFTAVQATATSPTVSQPYLAAFRADTGAFVTTFRPRVSGRVFELMASPDQTTLYVGGAFTTVNGIARRRIAALDPTTGALRPFAPRASGPVRALAMQGNTLYAGGGFATMNAIAQPNLAALDATTGTLLDTFDPPAPDAPVWDLALSPDGSRMYAGGPFGAVGTAPDSGFLVALDAASGAHDATFDPRPQGDVFEIVADPDGQHLYSVAAGIGGRVNAWRTSDGGSDWNVFSNGDTQAIALAGDTVYVGGHFAPENLCFICIGPTFDGVDRHRFIVAVEAKTGLVDYDWAPQSFGFPGVWSILADGDRVHLGGAFTSFGTRQQRRYARFSPAPADAVAPSTPGTPTAQQLSGTSATLRWNASTDNIGVRGYSVYRDGVMIDQVSGNTYTDTNLVPETAYSYHVVAFDRVGNTSAASPIGEITTPPAIVLVPRGSAWRYHDTDEDPGTTWNSAAFDDSAWSEGPGKLGYGDGDETTAIATSTRLTSYFRRTFTVDDPAAYRSLLIDVLRDDGAIVYLNGVELARSNMRSGPVTHATTAASAVLINENDYYRYVVPSTALVAGSNTLAVSVHNSATISVDIGFDLELSGSP